MVENTGLRDDADALSGFIDEMEWDGDAGGSEKTAASDTFDGIAEQVTTASNSAAEAAGRVADILSLQPKLDCLQSSITATLSTILTVIRDEVRPLNEEVSQLREQVALVFAILDMPDEQKAWLLSLASQGSTTMGSVISEIVGQHMTWNAEDFVVMFKGDLAKYVRGLANGRSITPDSVVVPAVQFAMDQRNL